MHLYRKTALVQFELFSGATESSLPLATERDFGVILSVDGVTYPAQNFRSPINDEQWRSEVLARGWNAHAVEHLSSLWKSLRAASLSAEAARFAVTDTIEKIGGAKPKTFEQFVREQQSEPAVQPAAARAQA